MVQPHSLEAGQKMPWVKLCACGTEFNHPAFSDQLPRNGVAPEAMLLTHLARLDSNIGLCSLVLWVLWPFSGGRDLRTPYVIIFNC